MEKDKEQLSHGKGDIEPDNILIDLKKYFLAIIGMTILTFIISCSQGGNRQRNSRSVGTGQSFSADMIVTLSSGQVMLEGKIFVTPEATRMDWKQGSSNLSSIRIEKENREFLYNHDKKAVYEMDLNEDEEVSNFLKSVNDYEEIEILGHEKVGGINCTKKKVRSSFQVMGMNVTNEMIIWQADGIDIPIRSEGEEGTVTELKNISKKTPASKLFQPIEGYTRVNNMMEVMGFGGMGFDNGNTDYNNEGSEEVTNQEFKEMIAKYQQNSDPESKEMAAHLKTMLSVRENMKDGHGSDMDDLTQEKDNDEEIDIDQVYDNATEMLKSVFTDPEEYEEMKKMMAVARDEAKEMDFSKGSARGMWSVIPQRKGDKVEDEFKVKNMYGAQLQTSSTMEDICSFYEKVLKPKGWKVVSDAVINGEGLFRLQNNEYSFTISSGDIENNRKLKNYTLQLSPDF